MAMEAWPQDYRAGVFHTHAVPIGAMLCEFQASPRHLVLCCQPHQQQSPLPQAAAAVLRHRLGCGTARLTQHAGTKCRRQQQEAGVCISIIRKLC